MTDTQTVLSILAADPEEEYISLPPGLFDHFWLRYIPEATFSMLQPILLKIPEKASKEEIIAYIKERFEAANKPVAFDFDSSDFQSEEERKEYELVRSREQKIRSVLEQNNLPYPSTVEESVQLLLRLGILVETEQDGKTVLDMVVDPFPKPQDVLEFEPAQLRRLEALQSGEETEDEEDALLIARRVLF